MKSFILSAALCAAIISFCTAQTLPSPSSQGIIGSQNSNGGLFSGSTTIGIPLFAATANNGATVPVSLSYGTSGIKVAQVSTPVGLGWNLNAGGTITRVIRGIPDEYGSMVDNPGMLDYNKLDGIVNGTVDSEKDLFYLSFPGGGGRFIFEGDFNEYFTENVWCNESYTDLQDCQQDCNGDDGCIANCHNYTMTRLQCEVRVSWSDFQTLPYSDINIKYHFDGYTDGEWEITDMSGVKYTFAATETTSSSSTEPDGLIFTNEYDYVSSWHLTSIEYPNLPASQKIIFSYSDEIDLEQIVENKKTFATAPLTGGALTFENTEITKSKTVTGVRYLEGIHFSKGDITFSYTNERDDLPGAKRLTSVTLSNKSGNEVSTYSFNQDYFSAKNSYWKGQYYPLSSPQKPEDNRLKLESIYKDGALVQSYVYRNELESITAFEINLYELPPRDSYYTDHWGYNNASNTQGNIYVPYPEVNASTEERPSATFTIDGMNRAPNQYAQANILSRINFPTGGYSLYTYDQHTSGSGVRLQKVETFDEADNRVAGSSFEYASPASFSNPVYHRTEDLNYKIATIDSNRDRLTLYENSLSSVLDLNGTSIGYGQVTVTDLMRGSKVEHYFRNDLRLSNVEPAKHSYTIADDGTFIDRGAINNPDHGPFSTNSISFYDRGSYITMKVFGEDDDVNPIFVRGYNYEDINSTPYYSVSSLAVEVKKDHGTSQDILTSQYDMEVKTYRLNSTTETSYENGGQVSKTTSYTYHGTFPTLTAQIDVDNSRGYDSRTYLSYPTDITSSTKHHIGTLSTMQSKNMHGVVVQSETQVDFANGYETTQVSLTRYKSEHSLIVPHRQFTLMETPKTSWVEDDLIMVNEYVDYNTEGLLLRRKGFDQVITNMEYDNNGFLTKTIVNPGTAYERTTEYDNKHLVGLNQVTDANGRKVSYEYDDRNRLLLTRDNDGNITSRYRYHTVSDNNELNAEIIVNYHLDGNYEDRTHQFLLENINCPYGECTYTWSWGDGTGTSTGVAASHIYTNPGSFAVKVVISNPEYNKSVVITKNISIEDATEWTLTLIDPQEHCIYDSNPPQAFSANIGAGISTCSPVDTYTYEWFYQWNSSGSFVPFGTGQQYETWPQNTNVTGTHQIRVTVTDNCGRSLSVTKEFKLIGDNGGSCQDTGGGSGPH